MTSEDTVLAITAAEVAQYRATHDCGLMQAKRAVLREKMRAAVESAKTVDDLKLVILALIDGKP